MIPIRLSQRIEVNEKDLEYIWERFIPAKTTGPWDTCYPADGGSDITAVYYPLKDKNGNEVMVNIAPLCSLDNEETLEAIDEYEINERIQQRADAINKEKKEELV